MTETIKNSFNAVSKTYRHRLPYHGTFFEKLSEKLSLTLESKILDICCGNGQLSIGFADKIKKSVAIDNSSGMLSVATQHPNIIYLNHDINSPPLPASLTNEIFDHFLLGRAIHWIRIDSLGDVIATNLNAGGSIVTCGAGWSSNTIWLRDFNRVRHSYSDGGQRELYGRSKLAQIGFKLVDALDIRCRTNCDLDFLLNHAMSYSSSEKKIKADFGNFEKILSDRMRPFLKDGLLSGEVSSWALIYKST